MLISYGASLIVWSHLHFCVKPSKVVSVLTPVCIATSGDICSEVTAREIWIHWAISTTCCLGNVRINASIMWNLNYFDVQKHSAKLRNLKKKRTRHRDFVLLLNSCFRMRDLKEEWGKMPLNLYSAAGERKELFWKQYEHGRVLSLLMPWPFSRMRFALSLLKARAHHCWVNQRST